MAANSERETLTTAATWRERVVDYLGLERNVAAASGAMLLLGMGEELWKKFCQNIWSHSALALV